MMTLNQIYTKNGSKLLNVHNFFLNPNLLNSNIKVTLTLQMSRWFVSRHGCADALGCSQLQSSLRLYARVLARQRFGTGTNPLPRTQAQHPSSPDQPSWTEAQADTSDNTYHISSLSYLAHPNVGVVVVMVIQGIITRGKLPKTRERIIASQHHSIIKA